MYQKQNVAIGAVILIVLCLVIGSYISKNDKVSIPIENKSALSVDFKDNFIKGCTEDEETSYSDCLCFYNSLEDQVGEDKLMDLALDYYKTEQFPKDVLNKVIDDCFSDR